MMTALAILWAIWWIVASIVKEIDDVKNPKLRPPRRFDMGGMPWN